MRYHSAWQGKIYSRSGKHPKYPSLVEATGYGTGDGLGGWNCRHSFFPFIEGVSEPTYTGAELEDLNAKNYEFNGIKMTEYEATQKQRSIERNIRRWKREYKAMDAAGLSADEAASKLAWWQKEQKSFLKQTGLKRQYVREEVLGFGRSDARKAVQAAKKDVAKYLNIGYNKDGTIKVTDDWTSKAHPTLQPTYKSNAVVDTLSRGGKQIDRTIYGEDGAQKTQIHGGDHGHPKQHPYGKNGEHAHDISWNKNGEAVRTTRELSSDEQKANADLLKGDD